jgi:hypothetical protein
MQAQEYQRHKEDMRTYKINLKVAKNDKNAVEPERPVMIHYYISDTTIEGLAEAFESNPRGLLITQDELAGLILGLNQYKGKQGNDREHILELFNCKPWKINRKLGCKIINSTGATIIGGIQTNILPRVFKSDAFQDGLLPRFLLLQLDDGSKKFTRQGVRKEDMANWNSLIVKCYEIPIDLDENEFVKPIILRLNDKAMDIWEGFYNDFYELRPFLTDRAKAFIPKLITYSLKFAGILHTVKMITEEKIICAKIDEEVISAAIKLTHFFAGQAVKIFKLYEPEQETFNEHAKRMINTLHTLRQEIKNGRLLLARIRETYNEGLSEKCQLESKSIASLLKSELTLQTRKGTDNDTFLIWEEEKIEELFRRVIRVIKEPES